MDRILIFGNSGSGKTWLASELSDSTKPCHSLDDIFWEPGGYNKKSSENGVSKEIEAIKNKSQWVVEGVFGHLLSEVITLSDVVIFLDLSWWACERALLNRGSESSNQLDKEKAENNFQDLLKWASEYSNRDTKASRVFHELLYNQFDKVKYRLSSRNEIDRFVKQYRC
jgi:adenylate kinase family enzyme